MASVTIPLSMLSISSKLHNTLSLEPGKMNSPDICQLGGGCLFLVEVLGAETWCAEAEAETSSCGTLVS